MDNLPILNIYRALELYRIIAPHMKDLSDSKSLDFIIKLIDNILQDKEEIYFYAIELMTGLSEQQVLQMTAEELLAACMDYLAINNPIYLHKFCTSLGYRHGIIE